MEQEFLKIFNKCTNIIGIIGTTITSAFGSQWVLFAGYLLLNLFDYITGTIKAKTKKEESSSKGLMGITKKVCYWILIVLSFLMSYLLVQVSSYININLEFVMLFGWFTLTCLIVNEARSVLENLIEIGIKVPNFLIKGLEAYSNVIESKFSDKVKKDSDNENLK